MSAPQPHPDARPAAAHPTPLQAQAGLDAHLLDLARACPKVLLHEHLDGGLRVGTLLELLRERGLTAPADSEATLAAWFDARVHAGSLPEYLRGFALTVAAMGTPRALERVAFEAAEDARAEGCVLAEFRVAPLLFEAHGVAGEAAVEALLTGLASSPLASGLIVCGMRHEPAERIAQAAALARRYAAQGVVGFDLAGPEAGWPATPHAALLAEVRAAGLGLTLHAGEADGAVRVREAVALGAQRIGHGVRLADVLGRPEEAAFLDGLRTQRVHFEVCPSSNVHTGAASSVARHPIGALWRAGLSVGVNTDNRLMSRTRSDLEAALLVAEAGLGWADLARMGLAAAEASFLPATARESAAAAIRRWADAQQLGL